MVKAESSNRRQRNNGGGYKGVRMRKWGKWVAETRLPNSRNRVWLGSYDTPEKAARAYDAGVYCLRGPGAEFNFPSHAPPNIDRSSGRLSSQEIQIVAARHAGEAPRAIPPPVVEDGHDSGHGPQALRGFGIAAVEDGGPAPPVAQNLDFPAASSTEVESVNLGYDEFNSGFDGFLGDF